jgi:drug/metabolite transporter (DMT)-like permease
MNFFLYIMTVLIWGSTWFAITYQLGTIPIDISICYRFGLASLLIFGWCFFKKLPLKFSWKAHFFLIAQGFFLFSINYMAAYAASHYIASGLNAIGFSMVLVFNIINSFIFYRTPLTRPVVFGAMCGVIGMMVTFWPALSTLDLSNESLYGIFLSLLGGVLASFGNMISARNQKENIPVTTSNAFAMGYGALWMMVVIWFKGIHLQFDTSYPYVISLVYLSIFGSIFAFGCYLTLLGRIGASRAAYALVMVPIVALGVSTIFEDFIWEPHVFAGIGLTILGNVIILAKKTARKNIVEETQVPVLLRKAA